MAAGRWSRRRLAPFWPWACGRPIRGHVEFLGGPLFFLPQLRAAFERALVAADGEVTG